MLTSGGLVCAALEAGWRIHRTFAARHRTAWTIYDPGSSATDVGPASRAEPWRGVEARPRRSGQRQLRARSGPGGASLRGS